MTDVSDETKNDVGTNNEVDRLKKQPVDWENLVVEWRKREDQLSRRKRLYEEQAGDMNWVREAYMVFLELAEKVARLLNDSDGKAEKGSLVELEEKMKEGLRKWPEYLETKKNHWKSRLEEQKKETGGDAVEEELREQEDEADELEEELETIERKIKKVIDPVFLFESRPYVCPYCDRKYVSVGWLKRHVRREHAGQTVPDIDEDRVRFKCPHCCKTYKTQGWLNRHLEEKHAEKEDPGEPESDSDEDCVKLRCPYCIKTYTKMGWLRRHLQEEHAKDTL
ncbi:unnamed protein product [Trypanosoma congolense IL3000]|uniref:WGS project CAEQ00000000 data, annotated contig 1139 n=1 Tax=Trypanosoma congolense (strain IL3000) TaxID=1068625 RepID=F9W425_TRYCI|nr:unnamed protein product [Trypanosoma congolense IL3000]